MKTCIAGLFAFALLVPVLHAAEAVNIAVKFKTVGKTDRDFQGPGGGDRNVETKDKVMEITLSAEQPVAVGSVKVEYYAVKMGMKGRLFVAAQGLSDVSLALRKPTVVTSESFSLTEKHKEGPQGRNNAHLEAEVTEYVVRVSNDKGKLLTEKMTSADAMAVVKEAKPGKKK